MRTGTWLVEQVIEAPPRGQLQPGVLYHSERLGFVQHLCACGCGLEVHVPTTGPGVTWTLSESPAGPTMHGSFSDRFHCQSHYSIMGGKTVWH